MFAQSEIAASERNAPSSPEPAPLRVLIVSEQALWIQTLDSILAPHGCDVHAAAGQHAPAEVQRVRPDAIIVHSGLSSVPAIDLCRQLRETGGLDALTPVLVITSGPCTREDRLSALRAGAWDCYGFPADPELLLLKLAVYSRAKYAQPSRATG